MGRIHSICVALLACLSLWAQDTPVFKSDVRLVRLLATVKDPSGNLIGTLEKHNFKVYDNGVEQQISVFEHHTDEPLSVSILIDTSGSTGKELKYETDSVSRFLKALFREGNPDDSAAIYAFNWQVVLLKSYTRHFDELERKLRGLKGEGGTSLYDAMFLAASDLSGREGRHVMIIVTDGGDTTSAKNYHQALESAQLADIVIYPILVMPITNDAGRNIGGENALTSIAAGTGGRVFAPSVGLQLDSAFTDILHDLRTQYLIGFYPHNVPLTKDRFHRIRLVVDRNGLRVQTRTGYYGDSER
jgi:Ca-activated chloride channel homolog